MFIIIWSFKGGKVDRREHSFEVYRRLVHYNTSRLTWSERSLFINFLSVVLEQDTVSFGVKSTTNENLSVKKKGQKKDITHVTTNLKKQ